MKIIARPTTARRAHRAPAATWWIIAVAAALIIVLAGNPIVTDLTLWAGFAIATRLSVVNRRRRRRAVHRAAAWQHLVVVEAVGIANATQRRVLVDVA